MCGLPRLLGALLVEGLQGRRYVSTDCLGHSQGLCLSDVEGQRPGPVDQGDFDLGDALFRLGPEDSDRAVVR